MKLSYIIVGSVVVGVGVCGYFYFKKKKECPVKSDVHKQSSSTETNTFTSTSNVNSTVNESFDVIAKQHREATEIIRDTVEEIKSISDEAEQKKKEIDELLDDLSK